METNELTKELSTDRSKEELLEQLLAEHRHLKARLRNLNRHIALTSAERAEVAQLKKLKLRAKDRIAYLRST